MISQLKNKIQNFKNILEISFDTKYKRKLNYVILFMICGMILELCGIGLIFPALKLITDQNFLENTYRFLGIQNMELTTLLFFLTFFFIFFYGFKNFFLWIVLKIFEVDLLQ